jgi:hypothetical protein
MVVVVVPSRWSSDCQDDDRNKRNDDTSRSTAGYGHLEVLQRAVANTCPFNKKGLYSRGKWVPPCNAIQ